MAVAAVKELIHTSCSHEDPCSTASDKVVQWVIRSVTQLSAETCRYAKDGSHGSWKKQPPISFETSDALGVISNTQNTCNTLDNG